MDFKKITKEDMAVIKPYVHTQNYGTCDLTVGAIYMWKDYFNYRYLIYKDMLIFMGLAEEEMDITAFSIPLGSGNFEEALEFIHDYCRRRGKEVLEFSAVPEGALERLKNYYNCPNRGGCHITDLTDWQDYVYLSEDLKTLRGKRYNSRRNHINFFKREYTDWSFTPVTAEDKAELLKFSEEFYKAHEHKGEVYEIEYNKSRLLIEEFEDFGFYAAKLKVNGKIAAFSIGERLGNTLFVHVEKASREIRGAYEVVNMEFAKMFSGDAEFINREEDVGDPGLRAAKRAYHPVKMLKKFNVAIKL